MLHWRDDYLEYILVFSRNPKTLHDTQADELFPKNIAQGSRPSIVVQKP